MTTMAVQISLVNNASAEPFRLVPPSFDAYVDESAPSVIWRRAAVGSFDLALVPVVMVPAVSRFMEPIGDYGVACSGPVGSVLLLAREPLARLIERQGRVYISSESETSRQLLTVLCVQEFGKQLCVTEDECEADAHLLIGDAALRRRQDSQSWTHVVDLCEWWHRRSGLPFVFARWLVGCSLSASTKRAAEAWLAESVNFANTAAGRLCLIHRTVGSGLFQTSEEAGIYFSALQSRFGSPERQGEQAFLNELRSTDAH